MAAVAVGAALKATPVRADTTNFELNGKIYTKFLWKNDDRRGCLSLSNPFWADNIGGNNGVCSEFELNMKGQVSKYVTAGVRIKSRYGALWQTWWENGDIRWDFPTDSTFHENTSGEALGQNHAQYMKLRGAFIRAALPIPMVRWVHIGASDFSMFNEWTVGKLRYIDRDNGNGVFVEGDMAGRSFRYHAGAIALPKLFIGPRWNTGLKDSDPLAAFWGQDWAYALKLEADPMDDLTVTAITNYIHDWEADRNDPDKQGIADASQGSDRAVDLEPRYRAFNATLEGDYSPNAVDWLHVNGLVAYSLNHVNPEYATPSLDQGFQPVVLMFDENGPRASHGVAGKVLVEAFDPFESGLSFKLEYFNIGAQFNSNFGARREADVLLTEGFITSGFINGGQLPTLNLANEFVDFDEPWYESIIGWHGATGIVEFLLGSLNLQAEYTFIEYNTDKQGRDVDNKFPDFLYTIGFTDTAAYTADFDYANVFDRGRDPRSVYKRDQDRQSHITVLNAEYLIPRVDITAAVKLKYIRDFEGRITENDDGSERTEDDYDGQLYLGYVFLSRQLSDELQAGIGWEYQYWDEKNRSGSQAGGFFDDTTEKHTARAKLTYNFGGLSVSYLLEYLHKDQERGQPGLPNQAWRVWRSKATAEAAW
jgi:hypothetical protein